jgi:tetratricopeptide (TPR) repeat protein
MFTRTLLATALIGAGLIGAAALDANRDARSAKEAALLSTIGQPYCVAPQRGAPQAQTFFFRLAMAQADAAAKPPRTEVAPFSRAIPDAAAIAQADANPVLVGDLGSLHFPITTAVRRAQQYFDQGLRLSFAFNHGEAVRAFRKARTLDPECAMCWWGEALVLGPHINAPMDATAVGPAFEAASRAQALAAKAGAKERALIEALAARYAPPTADARAERSALDRAYAEAMVQVAARHPDDASITVLAAEALMDLQPWDYWEGGGFTAKGRTADIMALLERALKAAPDHPGAIHFYIHMTENSSDPGRALPYAQRLGRLMPGAGHVVHMPFHTYFRVGMYREAVEANRQAVRADEAYIARSAPVGIYPLAYYPHNVHSLMASAQMAGDGATAIEAAAKLDQIVSAAAAKEVAWVQPIKVAPYFTHAQFSDAKTILALPDPGAELPFVQAMWHYARGVGLAQAGERAAAAAAADAIVRIGEANTFTDLAAAGIPAPEVLRLAERVVRGRIAQAGGDHAAAVRHFEAAVALEDSLAYTEPPYWYYPTRQSLGAALLLAGRADEAEEVLRASLARAPNNGWALFGLMKVYEQRGDRAGSRAIGRLLQQAWLGDREALSLSRL